jgi:murein DD-endopeptidase MepM/ murein hydrolase activator NlpD
VRVRPQSYLLPVALLICLFFCTNAFAEKKNRNYGEDADRDVKFYKDDYRNKAAGSNGDIISYNSKKKNADDYREYNTSKEPLKSGQKKDLNAGSREDKKKNTVKKSQDEYVYYIVKNGDTLFGIAKRSGVSVGNIQDINNLNQNSRIFKGMKLKIPSCRETKKTWKEPSGKVSQNVSKPVFLWPLKKVKSYSRDGKDGVKSIGIIIKGSPGGEVIASDDGVVKKVGYMRGYGKYIVVKHENRYITVYSNLMNVDVKAGDSVNKGGRIGNISDDMTLHFQIDRQGRPENPLNLLPGRG